MSVVIDYARAEGLSVIEGQVLRDNTAMLQMCEELGFEIRDDPDEPGIRLVRLALGGRGGAG